MSPEFSVCGRESPQSCWSQIIDWRKQQPAWSHFTSGFSWWEERAFFCEEFWTFSAPKTKFWTYLFRFLRLMVKDEALFNAHISHIKKGITEIQHFFPTGISSLLQTIRFPKKTKKMVGFIQRSSDPSQPDRVLDKKNSKIPMFFYVFIIFIITKFGENFEDKIDICFF